MAYAISGLSLLVTRSDSDPCFFWLNCDRMATCRDIGCRVSDSLVDGLGHAQLAGCQSHNSVKSQPQAAFLWLNHYSRQAGARTQVLTCDDDAAGILLARRCTDQWPMGCASGLTGMNAGPSSMPPQAREQAARLCLQRRGELSGQAAADGVVAAESHEAVPDKRVAVVEGALLQPAIGA